MSLRILFGLPILLVSLFSTQSRATDSCGGIFGGKTDYQVSFQENLGELKAFRTVLSVQLTILNHMDCFVTSVLNLQQFTIFIDFHNLTIVPSDI